MIEEYCEVPECTISFGNMLCLDRCVLPELKTLWELGVKTVCSCCGHGKDHEAYIRVDKNSAQTMLDLGYEFYEPHECSFYTDSVSFRAKHVKSEREKGKPTEPRNIKDIRKLWKEASGTLYEEDI